MATAQHFEDLTVWQDARVMVKEVYAITRLTGFRRDFSLRDQITRAATSAMSNIAEGFERGSRREFLQFLNIAKGSIGEVRSQLYVGLDQEYISQEKFTELKTSAIALSRRLARFVSYLQSCSGKSRLKNAARGAAS